MDLDRCGLHRVVVSPAIACQGDGSAAVGEALDTMDVGCRVEFGSLGRIMWGTVVDTACIWGRFVLHLDRRMVLPTKVEGHSIRSLGDARVGFDLRGVAHGIPVVKP